MSTVTTKLGLTKPIGIEQFSLATLNNNMDIIDAYAVNTVEKLAKGIVYENTGTASSGGFTSVTVINNIASFTFKANRRYIILWDAHMQSSVANDDVDIHIDTCSTADAANLTTGLTLKRQITQRMVGANVLNPFTNMAPVHFGSDTTLQIKFCAARAAGTGTINLIASAADTALYRIFDMGAQL